MTYQQLAELLEMEGFIETASELHGILCGRIAGGERLDAGQLQPALIESLDSDPELIENALPSLGLLYDQTLAALQDSSFAFKPLLPDEEADLALRVNALADWAQGFIAGLGDSGLSSDTVDKMLSEDTEGALHDLAAIAQAGFDGESEEDDEVDFFELEEYVRVAAILIFSELGELAEMTNAASTTIH